MTPIRPAMHQNHNAGRKEALPFADEEYHNRLAGLRDIMELHSLDAIVLTSMQNVAYYAGFIYCPFGRPYACVVTPTDCVTIGAGIDGGQPWRRSIGNSLTYTDWARDNFWRAVASVTGEGKSIGCEADHLTLDWSEKLNRFLKPRRGMDISPATMEQRMVKSEAEIALIRQGAHIAETGGHAMRDAMREGATELDIAITGRGAMEREIARRFPDAEFRDTWVWFQSGPNTDGAHNPVTNRKLKRGDILSLSCFPMISGYCTPLQRTLLLGEADSASVKIWEANLAARDLGLSLLKPGMSCAQVALRMNDLLAERELLQYRAAGYGSGYGIRSQYHGHEAGLELREDMDRVLEPGMVISMEPMLTIPVDLPGAGGYREQDLLVITEDGNERLGGFPCGPGDNIIG